MMYPRFSKYLMISVLLTLLSGVANASDFLSVIDATKNIIASRVFENEEGTRLAFSSIKVKSVKRAELDVTLYFPDGQTSSHQEAIINEGPHVRLEQIANGEISGNYLVSVEDPFHVLRIRPLDTATTNFISRECLFQQNQQMNVCYIKMKNDNDVFVTIFREIKNL